MSLGLRLSSAVTFLCLVAACANSPGGPSVETPGAEWPETSRATEAVGGGERDAAVVVGIEEYASLLRINGARANAKDWHKYLVDSHKVPVGNVAYLTGKLATKEQILAAVQEAAKKAQPGGKVWFIFVGHGAPAQGSDDGLLVGYDAVQTAQSLQDRSVSQRALVALLESGPGTPVMVLDSCFSGRDQHGNAVVEGLQPSKVVGVEGGRGVVMTAARSDEFAGPLPGVARPAFSYLVLGALRGWGDANQDGSVSAAEAYKYVTDAMDAVISDRSQTPELHGGGSALVLSKGGEAGPDLGELARRTASMHEMGYGKDVIDVPRPDFGAAADSKFTEVNLDVERAYDEAMAMQEQHPAAPEQRAEKWCALAGMVDQNPYLAQAQAICTDWNEFGTALRGKEGSMRTDYDKLRGFILLERKTSEQKAEAVTAFLTAYDGLGEGYPRIDAVRTSKPRVARGQMVELPDYRDVKGGIRPDGARGGDDERLHNQLLKAEKKAEKRGVSTRAYLEKRSVPPAGLIPLSGLGIVAGAAFAGGGVWALAKKDGDNDTQNLGVGVLVAGGAVLLGTVAALGSIIGTRKRNRKLLDYIAGAETGGQHAHVTASPGGLMVRF